MENYNGLEYRADFARYDYHEYNRTNGYGLTGEQLRQWVKRHKEGTPAQKTWVENMLNDINFHYESGLLHCGEYASVLEEL